MTTPIALLPESLRAKLDALRYITRRPRQSGQKGERHSVQRGTSLEFADYRNYSAGDDLRKLDWKVYARLERPYIKLHQDEEDLAIHLLLDLSASMIAKHDAARQLVAALGYIGLRASDRVTLHDLNGNAPLFSSRRREQIPVLIGLLHGLECAGQTDLDAALRGFAARERSGGLCILISDLFSSTPWQEGLNALLGRGHEVSVLHLLTAEELAPTLEGDLRLVDSETGQGRDVTLDASLVAAYERRLRAWQDGLRADCSKRRIGYYPLSTATPAADILLRDLRRGGLLR